MIENTETAQMMQDQYKQQLADANQAKTVLEGRVQRLVQERDNLIEQVWSFRLLHSFPVTVKNTKEIKFYLKLSED